jgi:hypothetical protein
MKTKAERDAAKQDKAARATLEDQARRDRLAAQDAAARQRLAERDAALVVPLFTEACPDGKCARCHGSQFKEQTVLGGNTKTVAKSGLIGAALSKKFVVCVTCDARYLKGLTIIYASRPVPHT